MESRMVKFYSKESNMVEIHAIPGHFATCHYNINYYIDITSLKTRIREAKEVARVLYQKIGRVPYVDTEEFEKGDMASTNRHETIYVVSPEMNSNNQLLFRDNIKPSIAGKHVILLSASTTTGKTIHRSLEGIRYYGGVIEAVASVFSTVSEMDGFAVHSVFHAEDLPGYAAYSADDCPFCKKGIKLDAVVNGFGYSKL